MHGQTHHVAPLPVCRRQPSVRGRWSVPSLFVVAQDEVGSHGADFIESDRGANDTGTTDHESGMVSKAAQSNQGRKVVKPYL